ncbi:unnamed protein product [Orchesella dallaii]|uniref:Condensation domain-containing protein n=1 Tax=Orchesella dallaii TaxID=48710 RepID=A0ABP1QLW7_9HEXA
MTRRGYNPKISPWEFILIENYDPHGKVCSIAELKRIPDEERHCVWIFRAHHCIFDGFSIYRLLISLSGQDVKLSSRRERQRCHSLAKGVTS